MLLHNQNWVKLSTTHVLYYNEPCSVCGVLAPGKLLLSPEEAVADSLKHLLVWLVEFPMQMLPKVPEGGCSYLASQQ